MTTDVSEWLMRGNAAGMIVFNDPIWAEQEYAMQRGDRPRGPYDPPLPDHFVDALLDHQKRLNTAKDLMLAAMCDDLPPNADSAAWMTVMKRFDLPGEMLCEDHLVWVPKALVEEYRALKAAPLPCSADLIGEHP